VRGNAAKCCVLFRSGRLSCDDAGVLTHESRRAVAAAGLVEQRRAFREVTIRNGELGRLFFGDFLWTSKESYQAPARGLYFVEMKAEG
jgi:hypothetical protein